jgi:hypothetical protein
MRSLIDYYINIKKGLKVKTKNFMGLIRANNVFIKKVY